MTEPLTPADCDLQNLPYMPLDVRRLRDSDLASTESPEACWAAVLLWAASWHQVPAASLPDDDRVLSNLSGYGRVVSEWQRVKEGALRGWVKCRDGRLYHPVVAEKANESWLSKLAHSHGKLKERLRKSYGKDAVLPAYTDWISAGKPADWPQSSAGAMAADATLSAGKLESSAGIPPETDNLPPERASASAGIPAEIALKGNGKGNGKGYVKEEIPGRAPVFPARAESLHDPADDPQSLPSPPMPIGQPSQAGAVCIAMRSRGIADVNPSHPELLALVAAGSGIDVFVDAAVAAVGKGKGFAYAVATVKGRMLDAAKTAAMALDVPRPLSSNRESFFERDQRLKAEQMAQWAPGIAKAPTMNFANPFEGLTIDATEVRHVASIARS